MQKSFWRCLLDYLRCLSVFYSLSEKVKSTKIAKNTPIDIHKMRAIFGSVLIWIFGCFNRSRACVLRGWHEIRSCRYQFRRNKNSFSEDWTPFVATNQHWKSFCHPILELVSFWFGTSKYFVTLFI